MWDLTASGRAHCIVPVWQGRDRNAICLARCQCIVLFRRSSRIKRPQVLTRNLAGGFAKPSDDMCDFLQEIPSQGIDLDQLMLLEDLDNVRSQKGAFVETLTAKAPTFQKQ